MTDFSSADHPRVASGQFTDKPQSSAEVRLDSDGIRIPDGRFHGTQVNADMSPVGRLTPGIAGYTYKADLYDPEALLRKLFAEGRISSGPLVNDGVSVETVIDGLAQLEKVNRDDEYSFDSDNFPKVVTDDQVTIHDHPALGLEYWDTPDYNDEPLTAEDALADWMNTEEIDFADFAYKTQVGGSPTAAEFEERAQTLRDQFFQNTHKDLTAAQNIAALEQGATNMGLDLAKLGFPLPTRHN